MKVSAIYELTASLNPFITGYKGEFLVWWVWGFLTNLTATGHKDKLEDGTCVRRPDSPENIRLRHW
ncbi:hypothetical protein Hamer_G026580 [Homarus americanus]|uniref:Uncharacterized protein n=2 Tax=Homarus americanus TaxID=6706 RepID=A0A8J5JXA9_HOMAM|nr:hypothetical protein Hamer_G026580 [Homarus americanus]